MLHKVRAGSLLHQVHLSLQDVELEEAPRKPLGLWYRRPLGVPLDHPPPALVPVRVGA